jgi:uncharacterized protein YbjT (DUF2867 family)
MNKRLLAILGLALALLAAAPSFAASDLVLVGGATGRTGRLITQLLLQEGFRVRGMTRDPDKAARDYGTTVEWVKADVRDPASLGPAFEGAKAFIDAIGTESFGGENGPEVVTYDGTRYLVDAARAAGTAYFGMISSGGVEDARAYIAKGLKDSATWRYKGEEYLRASALTYTIVRAGGLRDYPGGENGILLLQKEDIAPGLITRADVAAVMVECLARRSADDKTFSIVNYVGIDPEAWRKGLAALKPD